MNSEDKFEAGLERIYNRLGFKEQNCPICFANGREGIMVFRYSVVQQEPVADAVIMKCGTCRFCSAFGLPLTSEQFEDELSERGGTWFTPHWKDGSDPDEIVVKRLQELGYLEYEYRRQGSVV